MIIIKLNFYFLVEIMYSVTYFFVGVFSARKKRVKVVDKINEKTKHLVNIITIVISLLKNQSLYCEDDKFFLCEKYMLAVRKFNKSPF